MCALIFVTFRLSASKSFSADIYFEFCCLGSSVATETIEMIDIFLQNLKDVTVPYVESLTKQNFHVV